MQRAPQVRNGWRVQLVSAVQPGASGLPLSTDILRPPRHISNVPEADLRQWIAEYVCRRLIVLVGVFNG
jgi:hypothetical protein